MADATLDDALALVVSKFNGVKDKDGQPYILHCLRVMFGVTDPAARLVALMHDLVEDTDVTLNELQALGFADDIVQGVALMTHTEEDSYADYVVRLKCNDFAHSKAVGSAGQLLH